MSGLFDRFKSASTASFGWMKAVTVQTAEKVKPFITGYNKTNTNDTEKEVKEEEEASTSTTTPATDDTLFSSTYEDDTTAFTSGDLVLPFTHGDLALLTAIHQQSLALEKKFKTLTIPPAIYERFETKIAAVAELVKENIGTAEQWADVIQQENYGVYRILVLLNGHLAYPNTNPISLTLLRTTYILFTLQPTQMYHVVCQYPRILDIMLWGIAPPNVETPGEVELVTAMLCLVDFILVQGYGQKVKPVIIKPFQTVEDMEYVYEQLIGCLSHESTSIFALATSVMLLLNTLDTKCVLHKVLMAKQSEVANSPASSSSSSPKTPTSPVTTESLSRFSQELITLVNAGRLPATWIEEAETSSQHSGTRNTEHGVTDLYESTRAVVRALPDRETNCHALTSATLAFFAELFHQETALNLLYTNDIHVLVEVLIRKMEDQSEVLQLTLDYLLCLAAIVSWPEYQQRPVKDAEIRELLNILMNNYREPELSEEQLAALSEQEREEHETKDAIYQLASITSKKL